LLRPLAARSGPRVTRRQNLVQRRRHRRRQRRHRPRRPNRSLHFTVSKRALRTHLVGISRTRRMGSSAWCCLRHSTTSRRLRPTRRPAPRSTCTRSVRSCRTAWSTPRIAPREVTKSPTCLPRSRGSSPTVSLFATWRWPAIPQPRSRPPTAADPSASWIWNAGSAWWLSRLKTRPSLPFHPADVKKMFDSFKPDW